VHLCCVIRLLIMRQIELVQDANIDGDKINHKQLEMNKNLN